MIAIISKLPTDLENVKHILPFWFTYLYWFLWIAGTALVVILLIFLFSKLVQYLQSLKTAEELEQKLAAERRYTKVEIKRDLKLILDNTIKSQQYRTGLHRMSAVVKTYFEILLSKDIEEMTAKEIRTHVQDHKALGSFFTSLTVVQYRVNEPDKEEFVGYYNKSLELIK